MNQVMTVPQGNPDWPPNHMHAVFSLDLEKGLDIFTRTSWCLDTLAATIVPVHVRTSSIIAMRECVAATVLM